jgi:hypothetical protein
MMDTSITLLEVHKLMYSAAGDAPTGASVDARSRGVRRCPTAHWVLSKERAQTGEEVVEAFFDWEPPKRQFSAEQILAATDRLTAGGWVGERDRVLRNSDRSS